MRVCVLTLTRGRIVYSRECFAALHRNAGTAFDHYVLDQGSSDGTVAWLNLEYETGRVTDLLTLRDNIGICQGLNALLESLDVGAYDVIVKVDNDCLIHTPGTLLACAEVAARGNLVSPRIAGLNHPPPPVDDQIAFELENGPVLATPMSMIGGIFCAYPASFFAKWRFPDNQPLWGADDTTACRRAQLFGMKTLYLDGFEADHIETTQGQHLRFPDYFSRRVAEGGPP